jgi:uncharacterized protein (UPF0335 family)
MSLYKSDKELDFFPTLQRIDSLAEDVKLLIEKLERVENEIKEIKKEILNQCP